MGIPHLTRHLLPYAENVLLDGREIDSELPRVEAVVIDGPSLVYHIYRRLLSWMDPSSDVLDYQPTCDEISRGVSSFLLQLTRLGVKIHKICFDGALPVSKREIRFSRIEKLRHRLELARRNLSLPVTPKCRDVMPTERGQVWCSRGLPQRRKGLPENPFMVSAVFEDLRNRWNREQIRKEVDDDICCLADTDYPWAEITVMVPGEADVECASVAKLTGCAVLTDDSDLLLHDLGQHGAVLFLDSVQTSTGVWDPAEPDIRGLRICPHSLSGRLGISSVQWFAYELQRNVHMSFAELTRISKESSQATELSSEYLEFLREYQHETTDNEVVHGARQSLQPLDPRVSELFWQYELPSIYCLGEQPHVYLGILNEDSSRRCAWEQGRTYRSLGYSLFNLSRPVTNRFAAVHEFVRRGGRIVAEEITLSGTKTVASDMDLVRRRLATAHAAFDEGLSAESFWFLFALSDIYRDGAGTTTIPSGKELESFLTKGYMAQSTKWTDIHLLAQIQAALYSLRILKQLLDIAASGDDLNESSSLLADLPPLHIMMSRQKMIQSFANTRLVRHAVRQMIETYG
ncbi:Small-subunit processome Utp21 [Penicillium coprophilum]|uniref:Small-subunit processome Utp21 n=1 Tax=Penicillium coprophilum TaxID=36646 RepID=UPI0023854513|nr:Small-subunit processome Utp21 [Penicillium coprophilum]KAJ5162837.1 Small-subunit processome Utp21 [Penicillium coprophilum]